MPEKPPSPSNFPTPCKGGLAAKEQRALTNPGLPLLAPPGSQEGLATKRGRCHRLSVDEPASQQLPQPLPGSQTGLCREPRSPCQGGRVRAEPLLVGRKILAGSSANCITNWP